MELFEHVDELCRAAGTTLVKQQRLQQEEAARYESQGTVDLSQFKTEVGYVFHLRVHRMSDESPPRLL